MIGSDIADFIAVLEFERGLSKNTCAAYAADLSSFRRFLAKKGITSCEKAGRDDVMDFLRGQRDAGFRRSTVLRRSAAVRSWFKYLLSVRKITRNPVADMAGLRKGKVLPRTLSEEDVSAMIAAAGAGDDPRSVRDRAMLELLYGCGLRVSELCDLESDSIVAGGELLRVRGKGSKERLVPIGGAAGEALVTYLEKGRGHFSKGDLSVPQLFLTRLAKPFTRQGVFKIVRGRALEAGIAPERVSPHVLRHCFATHMLGHGADVRAIQELLGHSDVGTTQIYTHVDSGRFGDLHRRYHPRG